MMAFDFDGVMTDNAVYVSEDGTEMVRCSRWEGFGLARLREMGIHLVVISTEVNPVVGHRCAKLRLECHQGVADKLGLLQGLALARGLGLHEVGYVGNGATGLVCLAAVGFPVVVADAHPSVVPLAAYRTKMLGGHGAVREVCDLIVEALNREA